MPRVLTLDAFMATSSAGLVADGVLLGWCRAEADLAELPLLVEALFADHGRHLDIVAVVAGPGSFTGLRASIALAHGLGLASGASVVGVTVAAALNPGGARPIWAAVDSKRGRVFLDRSGEIGSFAVDALPLPTGPIALGGDAALAAGEFLASQGVDVQLTTPLLPDPLGIAAAALAGRTVAPQPVYVDPPAARPGAAGRPAPA
ncbi:MAG: tRNA (adenosine(37)-N6)-threonylcarbamoyltransferase complex dimerization subunit type 1 TsaB [Acetobacteraceae bacterium]|nr:tRNA (adenosine(37)-N6)-threonylcarbamoyltransferase complex dimerization subunit type 1 TsaB [Acetobacteraceae bacterium]